MGKSPENFTFAFFRPGSEQCFRGNFAGESYLKRNLLFTHLRDCRTWPIELNMFIAIDIKSMLHRYYKA